MFGNCFLAFLIKLQILKCQLQPLLRLVSHFPSSKICQLVQNYSTDGKYRNVKCNKMSPFWFMISDKLWRFDCLDFCEETTKSLEYRKCLETGKRQNPLNTESVQKHWNSKILWIRKVSGNRENIKIRWTLSVFRD